MYADRHAPPEGIKPGSLAVAVGINAAVVAALALSNPTVVDVIRDRALPVVNIPLDPPPPLEPVPQPKIKPQPQQRQVTQPERVELTKSVLADPVGATYPPLPPLPPQPLPAGPGGGGAVIEPPVLPALIGAIADPRFARDLQPDYPASERRLEREGKVRLRVLVGVDGRVKQVERLDATSDAFFQATERQALAKWRFKPATRGGIPEESWKVMTVTFRLEQE